MGDSIREKSDEDQDPREEYLVEYQEETQLEIQDIQLEAGMPQDTSNKNLCKHTQDALAFVVTPTKKKEYIHGKATRMAVYIENSQHPLIIDSGAHFSIVARKYLDNHSPNWEKQLLPTKANRFKSASVKMTSIGKIIKEIVIPHRKEELLNKFREGQFSSTLTKKQKLCLLKILGKNRPAFAIGEESLGKITGHDLERPYPPILRRPPYPASLEARKEIKKHINELLEIDVIRKIQHKEIVEITTPVLIIWYDGKSRLCGDVGALNNYTKADRYPIPRIPHALEKLEKAKYITKMNFMKGFHHNGLEPNSIKVLRIICHMGIYEYTGMPFGIRNAPAHFQRIMDTIFQEKILEGLMVLHIDDIIIYSETWEDHMQYIDRVLSKCTPINLKISLKEFNFGQQKLLALGHTVSGLSLAIDQNKVAEVLLKQVPKNLKEMKSFLGFASYYRTHIRNVSHIASSLYKLCSKEVVFRITKERRDAYERIKHDLTNEPLLILPDIELPFKLYIDAACSQGLREAFDQRKIVDGEPREGVICYISRKLKHLKAWYGETQTECLCLVWALEKLHYYLEGAVFEVYKDCTALKSLLNIKTTNGHNLRRQIAIQEYRGNINII
ncbi:hypothetical protein O181_044543 [Austropuccinia psidii MF-1]|uniref:Reverse transcriptase domain-containing protein n=1 Tax=Austropuccinia psidii MF-1 TaxID=1389203 RepID=A0A9Q3DNI4_9BASI|nr:hypothetical protein [Austropuccinia psidii MF-1]